MTLFICICCILCSLFAEEAESGETIGRAIIKNDSLAVHSRMSDSSIIVKHLKKGDVVTVEFAVIGEKGEWCGIREETQTALLGYVRCLSLQRDAGQKKNLKDIGTEDITVQESTSAQAETTEMKWLKEKMKFINERANWKLFKEAGGLEFYYDANSTQALFRRPTADSVVVTVKMVYKSQKAINRLKYERERAYSDSARFNNEPFNYNYNDFAFSITTGEIYCTKKKVVLQTEDITADFDNQGNILNIVPGVSAILPISPNTPLESLYALICQKDRNNKNVEIRDKKE